MNTLRACALLAAIAAFATNMYAAQVGDTVIWRNSGTAGTKSDQANCSGSDLQFCLSAMDGVPIGSVVMVTSVSLGSRNQTFTSSTDPQSILIRKPDDSYYWSHEVNGTGSFSGETISAKGTYVPRLSYSFDGKNAQIVVGVTNKLQTVIGGNYLLTPGFKLVDTRNSYDAIMHPTLAGTDWCPVYEITATIVSLGSDCDTSATISGNANLSALSWSSPMTTDGTQWGRLNVTGNAALTLDAATNFKLMTINVAEGKTLALSGANALTATKIEISGKGTVAAATSSLNGAITGCGNVVYTGALPSGVTFDYDWCGTLVLAGCSITGPNFNNYGNVVSAIKLSGVSGWVHTTQGEYVVPIILEDDNYGFALKLTNGNSPNSNNQNQCSTFRKISGDGSLVDGIAQDPDGKWAWPVVKIYDATGFTGNILLNRRANVIVCDPTTSFPDTFYNMFNLGNYEYLKDGVLRIDGDRSPTLADGKTWKTNLYTNETDYNDLVVFEKSRTGLLDGGDLNLYVNGNPLDTSVYTVREGRGSMRGHIVVRRIFGFRLRLF